MIRETENPTNRYQVLHLQMIGTIEACLYRLRDITINTQRLRINADNNLLGAMQIERNILVALLGELNASMKRMDMLDDANLNDIDILRAINKLKGRVHNAQLHYMPESLVFKYGIAKAS